MVKLRLTRLGKKKRPFYRIVAMDNRTRQGGQALARIGTYDPMGARLEVDEETALKWLERGACMSETVEALLRSQGILARWRGFEGTQKEQVLNQDKPARRRKVGKGAASAGPEPEPEAEPQPEPAPEAEASAEPEASPDKAVDTGDQ